MSNKIELTREEQQLFNELKKLSKRANQRIVRLERAFGKNTLTVRQLQEKLAAEPLQAWTISGRVRVTKSMTPTQYMAAIRATEQFLSNKLTTKRGIKKAKIKAIKTLQARYGSAIEGGELSYAEVETLANFFEDKEVNAITNYIKGSDVIAIIEEARASNWDYETFLDTMNSYIIYNKGRGNVEQIIRKIYVKYVYKGNKNKSEIDILYNNIESSIDLANSIDDLEELASIVEDLKANDKIDDKEYNYLISKINEKMKG